MSMLICLMQSGCLSTRNLNTSYKKLNHQVSAMRNMADDGADDFAEQNSVLIQPSSSYEKKTCTRTYITGTNILYQVSRMRNGSSDTSLTHIIN